ncbi:MAG: hypothetical protein AUG44_19120 [Actinobacteria bacterium 13_1_20CM_3_71_11]|nr:MAG: hypothetical protein AUG44_19120 [Actinobacteria bacterium 13_1_20CM_3_71_11]
MLNQYDLLVMRLITPGVWRCPRRELVDLYSRNLGARHLDLGPGTGLFLDICPFPVAQPRVALVDLNENSLRVAAARIRRYQPLTFQRDVLQPLELGPERFDSAGLNFLLHCIPGPIERKAVVFDHIAEYLTPEGRVFGSTVLAHGVRHRWPAGPLLRAYQRWGVFQNGADSLDALCTALTRRFSEVRVRRFGSVALFEASGPLRGRTDTPPSG